MEETNPISAEETHVPHDGRAVSVSRRRIIQAIVATAPAILTVTARRAHAQGSAEVSGGSTAP
jgi:hypothetical protein